MRSRTRELIMCHKLPGVTGRHCFWADERLVVDAFKEDYVANNEGTWEILGYAPIFPQVKILVEHRNHEPKGE